MSFFGRCAIPIWLICYNKRMLKNERYTNLYKQAAELMNNRFGWLSNAANLSALIFQTLPDLNWVGFYLLDRNTLRLGPFQGKVACTEIPIGKGVCGTAAAQQKTLAVADVHQFSGHIACDSASQSEIVIPILVQGQVWGVLDIDAPIQNRFEETDRTELEKLVQLFIQKSFCK